MNNKLEAIAKKCKASVHLEYRSQSSYYETLKEAVSYDDDDKDTNFLHVSNFLDGELEKCLETDEYWQLQFYPDTPISSYSASRTTWKNYLIGHYLF